MDLFAEGWRCVDGHFEDRHAERFALRVDAQRARTAAGEMPGRRKFNASRLGTSYRVTPPTPSGRKNSSTARR